MESTPEIILVPYKLLAVKNTFYIHYFISDNAK